MTGSSARPTPQLPLAVPDPPTSPLAAVLAVLVASVAGWAVAAMPDDPRPVLALLAAFALVVCLRHVAFAAAGLAFVVAGNLAHVAQNVHGLPSPTVALAAVVGLGLLVHGLVWTARPPTRLALPIACYLAVVAASIGWSADPAAALESTVDLTKDVVVAVVVAGTIRATGRWRLVLWAIVGGATFVAAFTAYQYLTGDVERTFAGFAETTVANIVGAEEDHRLAGTFGDPNFYAQMLVVALAIAANRLLFERRLIVKLVATAATVVLAIGVVATFSRGAVLTLIAVVALLLVRWRGWRALAAAALLGLVLWTVALPDAYRERLSAAGDVANVEAPEDVAVRGRLSEMLAGGRMFADHPLLGVGIANYPGLYQDYARELRLDPRRSERAPHSLYVEVAAETGVLGLTALAWLLCAAALTLRRSALGRAGPDRPLGEDPGLTSALGLALLAFLLTSVFLHAAHARMLWLLLALALSLPQRHEPAPEHRSGWPRARSSGAGLASPRHLDGPGPTG